MQNDLISRSGLLEKLNDTGVQITFDLPVEEILGEDVDIDDFSMLVQDAVQVYRKMIIDTIQNQPTSYNDGWIPVSSGKLPEDCTIYEVTAQFGNGMCYTEFAYYDESKGEWWKHDDDGLVNVLAWKEHFAPYQPKGE